MPGSLAPYTPGTLLIAFRAGLALVELASGHETALPNAVDFANERFNDGKTDRRGRFFVGTMDRKMENRIGGLYRVGLDRSVTHLAGDMQLANGIAWSPDNRTMYHCDSRPGCVFAYDYDIETGAPSNRRVFIAPLDGGHHTDGCTVDADGCLWLAEVGLGRVGRYAPDGRRIGQIDVPAERVASVMFGGRDLDTLYITTIRYGLSAQDMTKQPLAGRLFAARPGVKGLPETPFAG
jgi:L-arabinonolactonase